MNKLVKIELHSYDINDWKNALIKQCMEDHPDKTVSYLAKLLKISKSNIELRADKMEIEWRKQEEKKSSTLPEWELEKISKFKKE